MVPQQTGNACDTAWDIGSATAEPGGCRMPYTLTCADGDPACDSDGAANVPVCVVSRFRESPITDTVNLQTGEMQSTVKLFADTYVRLGKADLVCPRCNNRRCVGGKRDDTYTSPPGHAGLARSDLPEDGSGGEPGRRFLHPPPLRHPDRHRLRVAMRPGPSPSPAGRTVRAIMGPTGESRQGTFCRMWPRSRSAGRTRLTRRGVACRVAGFVN